MLQQLQEAACDIQDDEKKETCLGLNLVLQFLFQELKDTQKVRRYVLYCEKTVTSATKIVYCYCAKTYFVL